MKYYILLNGVRHEVEMPRYGTPDQIIVNGETLQITSIQPNRGDSLTIHVNNRAYRVFVNENHDRLHLLISGEDFETEVWDEREESIRRMVGAKGKKREGAGVVKAPMPGLVVKLLVNAGDEVKKGQGIIIVEAMKMENEIPSPVDGTVKECKVEAGMVVNKGELLMTIESNGA